GVGRSRGGLTTRLHALVDGRGRPVAFKLTPGQVHDSKVAGDILAQLAPGQILMADKAYDSNAILATIRARGATPNIPAKAPRKLPHANDRALYRRRNIIERFFNKLKQYRGLATRYDKHAETFMAGVTLAAIRIAIRA
ncbi:IS5 family transposase, partial [Sinisalibacter aestuarii]|uniref:IS5 family transposase n=1 Tax=Sinisalibacter aestuarii TaxID=2949426 RepID=UPI0024934C40